jgi:hypothetical protein
LYVFSSRLVPERAAKLMDKHPIQNLNLWNEHDFI